MATSFAPYQDTDPSTERALSPPRAHQSRNSYEPVKGRPQAERTISEVTDPYLPPPDDFAQNDDHPTNRHDLRQQNLEAFQTSLPMRLDYEAVLAYVLLPPAGGVLLLLLEHKSDYVRFHAWQSILSWMLFALDLVLIAFLSSRAYRDVDTLEHFEVPIIGRIANRFVDDE